MKTLLFFISIFMFFANTADAEMKRVHSSPVDSSLSRGIYVDI